MLRAIFVEDDDFYSGFVAKHLAKRQIRVELVPTVAAGFERALRGGFDVILLDWNFREGDGCSLCLELRKHGVRQPILMFTQRDEDSDAVAALACGADEFVTKGIDFDVLAAKLRAHVRRGPWASLSTHEVGRIRVDADAGMAWVDETRLMLTQSEFKLLCILAEQHGQPIARDEVMRRMWGGGPTRCGSAAADADDAGAREARAGRGRAASFASRRAQDCARG